MRYFFEQILKRKEFDDEQAAALKKFSYLVTKGMMSCPESSGLRQFLRKIPKGRQKIIVSGGSQKEIRSIFAKRKLDKYFNAIYGSPDSKEAILERERRREKLPTPIIFVGDSKYDYTSSVKVEADFVFMSQYTEFKGWKNYFKAKKVYIVKNLESLVW